MQGCIKRDSTSIIDQVYQRLSICGSMIVDALTRKNFNCGKSEIVNLQVVSMVKFFQTSNLRLELELELEGPFCKQALKFQTRGGIE
jgi:hypothetical protein